MIRLKYLIFEKSYTFFSIFSWFFISLSSYDLCFQVLTITAFPFLVFPTFPFLCLLFTALKQKTLKNIFSIDLILFVPSQIFLISQKIFCDYQVNLGNTTNLNSSPEGWRYSINLGRGEEPYVGGLGILLGDLITT